MHFPIWQSGYTSRRQCLEHINQALVHDARLNDGACVLDLGAGLGSTAISFAQAFGCTVIGIVSTTYEAEVATRRSADTNVDVLCKYIASDINDLTSFRNHSFQAVVTLETDCYLNLPTGMREIHRLLQCHEGLWQNVRLSVADGASDKYEVKAASRLIQSAWRTFPWCETHTFEADANKWFTIEKCIDLREGVIEFWNRCIPLPLDSRFRVYIAFLRSAIRESKRIRDMKTVYLHRLAFWQFIYGLAQGWFDYRYYVLRPQ